MMFSIHTRSKGLAGKGYKLFKKNFAVKKQNKESVRLGIFLWICRRIGWRNLFTGGKKGIPCLSRLRFELGRPAGNRWNEDEVFATRALNLPTGELRIALQVLLAMRTGKFKLIHNIFYYVRNFIPYFNFYPIFFRFAAESVWPSICLPDRAGSS
jgi:hypothetical protein